MESINGYHQAALSLYELDVEEQAWFLSQLDEHDRREVGRLLREMRTLDVSGMQNRQASTPIAPEPDDEQFLKIMQRLDLAALSALLSEQPDWVIAVLQARAATPTLQRYIEQLPPLRQDQVLTLADQLRRSLKPAACRAVWTSLVKQLPASALVAARSHFDSVLTHVSDNPHE